jgi:hypothetical protein
MRATTTNPRAQKRNAVSVDAGSVTYRMDAARATAPPTPRWCSEKARDEVKKGRYEFDADEGTSRS